jgi:hypothetical protein
VAVQAKPLGGDTRLSWASLTRPGELLGPRLADVHLTAWFRDSYLMRAWCGAMRHTMWRQRLGGGLHRSICPRGKAADTVWLPKAPPGLWLSAASIRG